MFHFLLISCAVVGAAVIVLTNLNWAMIARGRPRNGPGPRPIFTPSGD